MKLCLFQWLYYVIVGTGQNSVIWFPSGTANFFSGYVGRCVVWNAVLLDPFRIGQRKAQYSYGSHPSLCWLPSNWVNSPGKKDVTDLCTGCAYKGSGSCAVFILQAWNILAQSIFSTFSGLQYSFSAFLSKSPLARWLI